MAKKITYQDEECYVEYANKDSKGNVINDTYQEKLVSGTNIKTINSTSLLGSGNIYIPSVDNVISVYNYAIRQKFTSYVSYSFGFPSASLPNRVCHRYFYSGVVRYLFTIAKDSSGSIIYCQLYEPEIILMYSTIIIVRGFNTSFVYSTYTITGTSTLFVTCASSTTTCLVLEKNC